jgi:hypothetical protein
MIRLPHDAATILGDVRMPPTEPSEDYLLRPISALPNEGESRDEGQPFTKVTKADRAPQRASNTSLILVASASMLIVAES